MRPPAAFLKEQATSALGPVAHKAPGPEPSPHGPPAAAQGGVWWPLKALKALKFLVGVGTESQRGLFPPFFYQQHAPWGPSRVFSARSIERPMHEERAELEWSAYDFPES